MQKNHKLCQKIMKNLSFHQENSRKFHQKIANQMQISSKDYETNTNFVKKLWSKCKFHKKSRETTMNFIIRDEVTSNFMKRFLKNTNFAKALRKEQLVLRGDSFLHFVHSTLTFQEICCEFQKFFFSTQNCLCPIYSLKSWEIWKK